MNSVVIIQEMPKLLQKTIIELRSRGDNISSRAAGLIESLWKDNVNLSVGLLSCEAMIRETVDTHISELAGYLEPK